MINIDLDETFYNSIRRLLGGVDEDTLTDEDISDSAIVDFVELEILGLVPNYNELDEQSKAKVHLAFRYMVASSLAPVMASRVDIEVKTIDVTWKRKAIDYAELADSLYQRAMALLEGLTSMGGDSIIFTIAPSKRAVREHEDN